MPEQNLHLLNRFPLVGLKKSSSLLEILSHLWGLNQMEENRQIPKDWIG